jgi:hypothetical protein
MMGKRLPVSFLCLAFLVVASAQTTPKRIVSLVPS